MCKHVFMFRLFGLLLVGLVLAGCQTLYSTYNQEYVDPLSNQILNQRNKDILVTFPAWTSEHEKHDRLNIEAASIAGRRCGGGKFRITEAISGRWNEHKLTNPSYNFIEGNVECTENSVSKGQRVVDEQSKPGFFANMDDTYVCMIAKNRKSWSKTHPQYVQEAKRRGLSCGVSVMASSQRVTEQKSDIRIKSETITMGFAPTSTYGLCNLTTKLDETGKRIWDENPKFKKEIRALKENSEDCGVSETPMTGIASLNTTQSNTPTSAELLAAQRKSEELEQQLAALKAQQEQQQQTISNDTQIPLITIASADTKGKQGVIRGRASDNVGVAEVTASGQPIPFDAAGNFHYQTFVPTGGKDIVIEVTDVAGLTSKQTVSLIRSAGTATAAITFDSLNPLGRRVATNKNALALIIGVDGYENTPARAIYADSDAQIFADYATEKLGIPANRIKTLVNDSADFGDVLLSVREWLGRSVRQNKTDVHVFFAGHGLASENGEEMYLLPYDGRPQLLNETAISRERLFADISAANPRSVTVFLDTCYSGTTRGTDMLIASRPIAIRALEQSIPDNFTVMTAAAGDQTAKPLEEAKHGMFSYFLMKGMEGEADANNDNEITAGELHSYVQTNVIQQSSGSQTPELQGNADRVLVTFK